MCERICQWIKENQWKENEEESDKESFFFSYFFEFLLLPRYFSRRRRFCSRSHRKTDPFLNRHIPIDRYTVCSVRHLTAQTQGMTSIDRRHRRLGECFLHRWRCYAHVNTFCPSVTLSSVNFSGIFIGSREEEEKKMLFFHFLILFFFVCLIRWNKLTTPAKGKSHARQTKNEEKKRQQRNEERRTLIQQVFHPHQ